MIMHHPPVAAWLLAQCGEPVSPFDNAEAQEGRISITTAFGTLEKAAGLPGQRDHPVPP
jgi:hypothetical protein